MKKLFIIIILILLFGAGVFLIIKQRPSRNLPSPIIIQTMPMKIQSPVFKDGENIPSKYTCDGEGVNPPLEIFDAPKDARSLVLIVDDPDAPNGTWAHWVMWNIDPTISSIPEKFVPPKAIQGQTSSGQNIYGGPCPPSGQHRYFFKLYALDNKLSIPSYSTAADLEKAIAGHILQQAQIMGVYGRGK